jgi:tripartite-type tricarboxylate transporter receptor subunit TctC
MLGSEQACVRCAANNKLWRGVMLRKWAAASFAVGVLVSPSLASAQPYPSQPIRLIVPFAAGGGSDLLGRITGEGLSRVLGQPVMVENKPGAASTIGADLVLKAKPDGYTLLFAASDTVSVVPAIKANMPYKSPDDFAFIAQVSGNAFYLAVKAGLPVHTLADFIAYAKANPGKLTIATSGLGSMPHMASELVARHAGIEVKHVHFNGGGPSITAVMGGHVDAVYGPPSIKSFVDSGNVRIIATTDKVRHPSFPDAPTLAEAGLPGLTVGLVYGVVASAQTPEPVLARLRQAADEMIKQPVTIERLKAIGFEPADLVGDRFRDFVTQDLARWKDVAKSANIAID